MYTISKYCSSSRHVTKEIVLKYRARDSRTGERLYPGDKVMFTPKRFFWKTVIDEKTGDEKKLFLNEYVLVERCRKQWPKCECC